MRTANRRFQGFLHRRLVVLPHCISVVNHLVSFGTNEDQVISIQPISRTILQSLDMMNNRTGHESPLRHSQILVTAASPRPYCPLCFRPRGRMIERCRAFVPVFPVVVPIPSGLAGTSHPLRFRFSTRGANRFQHLHIPFPFLPPLHPPIYLYSLLCVCSFFFFYLSSFLFFGSFFSFLLSFFFFFL